MSIFFYPIFTLILAKKLKDEFFDYESGIFALDGEMQCPECKTDLPV